MSCIQLISTYWQAPDQVPVVPVPVKSKAKEKGNFQVYPEAELAKPKLIC